jgi:hypothetical protein
VAPSALAFPALPDVQPSRRTNCVAVLEDWVHPPRTPDKIYTTLVPQVDADGNEVAGVRLPTIAVPVATHTGWNLYNIPGLEGEFCDREGMCLPFATTKAERLAKGDPRPSLEERYGSHAAYVQRVSEIVRELLQARLLLPEDATRFVDAAARQDLFKA